MLRYVPILKSKQAEIWAWTNASQMVLYATRVVFEIDPNPAPPVIDNFVNRLARNYPTGRVITVDCNWLDQNPRATIETSQALAQNKIAECPVFRLDDSSVIVRQIRQAAALHGEGACLRLGSEEDDPDPNVPIQDVLAIIDDLDLTISDIDLIIDFKVVESRRDVTRCTPLALNMLAWARRCGNWRSVTLASGAFVNSISDLPVNTVSQLRRFDAILFADVMQSNPVITPDFGDYGITHPILMPTPPRAPNPNLRYTDDLQWQIDREARRLPGNESFYTICQRLVQASYWRGANYSAGDSRLDEYARRVSGPGNPTSWLSFGQSHHIAHVVDRLATRGVP